MTNATQEATVPCRKSIGSWLVPSFTGLCLWLASVPGPVAAEPGQAADSSARTGDAREPAVKELITRYFRTWSEQDMKGYDDCFSREACIQFIDSKGELSASSRARFVAGQREYHRTSPQKTVEVPESIDVHFEGKLARVVAYWKLTAGTRVEKGYDHFTLMKDEGNWRIIHLVFYISP